MMLCHIPKSVNRIKSGQLVTAFAKMSSVSRVAILQLTSTSDKQRNRDKCRELLTKAKLHGAEAAFLPEAFDFIGESSRQSWELAEYLDQDDGTVEFYKNLAKELNMSLSLGGFHEKIPNVQKLANSHVFISQTGHIKAVYRKTHLFDVDIPDKGVKLKESDYVQAGSAIGWPIQLLDAPNCGFNVGLAICYDLRFPELALILRRRGANILTYPSAFTVPTGAAGHWFTLLAARAIETQSYVIAAAQTGKHHAKRSSFGHACIIDPWGTVIAQCPEGEGIVVAELNTTRVKDVRRDMPIESHSRNDLYGLSADGEVHVADEEIDGQSFDFGQVFVAGRHVVLVSRLSIALVNRKPVVPGHLLVIPRRLVKRLSDVTPDELQDLFMTVQVAQRLVESYFFAMASTISVQDGKEAGQTVDHVHVHILPRKVGDFVRNDDIYDQLQNHDKGDDVKWRDSRDMVDESNSLRAHFKSLC